MVPPTRAGITSITRLPRPSEREGIRLADPRCRIPVSVPPRGGSLQTRGADAMQRNGRSGIAERNVNPNLDRIRAYKPGATTSDIAQKYGVSEASLVKLSSN